MPPARPAPLCCAFCESRTLRRHCEFAGCAWVRCNKCEAVSGVVAVYEGGEFTRFERRNFGGEPRLGAG